MDKLQPFFSRYLHAPKISYVMCFQEFIEVEEVLADLESGIIDLDDLDKAVKEKRNKKKF